MNAPHSSRFAELLPAYALGALDGDDLRELEAHLASDCAACRRELALWRQDVEKLAASVPPLEPSQTTRARVLKLAGGAAVPTPAPAPQRRSRWLPLAAAVLIVTAAWGLFGQLRLSRVIASLDADRGRLERQVATLEREVDVARAEARRSALALQVLAGPGVRSVVLAGLGSAPGAAGHTYVNPQTRDALFYAFNLPALPADRTYQLWFIADDKPVSAGTFSVDPRGTGNLRVEQVVEIEDIQAWAVTVEPQGGVPQPTGEMVLKG